MIPVTGAVT